MTCIIAHRDGWMAADRRKTFDGSLIGPYVSAKIFRAESMLVATAGAGELNGIVQRAVFERDTSTEHPLTSVVNVFLESVRPDGMPGHALVLTEGRIFEVCSRGDLCEIAPEVTHWAIGSGYQFALGYLAALERDRRVTSDDACAAILFAATRVNDVGDGIQVERL